MILELINLLVLGIWIYRIRERVEKLESNASLDEEDICFLSYKIKHLEKITKHLNQNTQ